MSFKLKVKEFLTFRSAPDPEQHNRDIQVYLDSLVAEHEKTIEQMNTQSDHTVTRWREHEKVAAHGR